MNLKWSLLLIGVLSVGGWSHSLSSPVESAGPLEEMGSWKANPAGIDLPLAPGDLGSQVVEDSNGRLIVAFAGVESGDKIAKVYVRAQDKETREWQALGTFGDGERSAVLPRLSLTSGGLDVTWRTLGNRRAPGTVGHAFSPDEGTTWITKALPGGWSVSRPEVCYDAEGTRYLAFSGAPERGEAERVRLFSSGNLQGDAEWKEASISSGETGLPGYSPQFWKDESGGVQLTYLDGARGQNKVMFSRLDEKAGEWVKPVIVSYPGLGPASDPMLEALKGSLFVFWTVRSLHERTVGMTHSEDGGKTWSPAVTLVQNRVEEFQPCLVKGEDSLFFYWLQSFGPSHLRKYSIWRKQISAVNARIGPDELLKETQSELRSLSVAHFGGRLVMSTVESDRTGAKPLLLVATEGSGEFSEAWHSAADVQGDYPMMGLVRGMPNLILVYRESPLAAVQPGLGAQKGDFRIVEFSSSSSGSGGE